MTIEQALHESVRIVERTSSSPWLDCEILLAHILKSGREYIHIHGEVLLSNEQSKAFRDLARQRAAGTPIAYLIGNKEFYGYDFQITPDVLVPRPETELLVENLIKLLRIMPDQDMNIIDIGTGSGCIITSAAKEIAKLSCTKKIRYLAIDISPKALDLAYVNALNNEVGDDIEFIVGDLLSPFMGIGNTHNHQLSGRTLIAANLPYLTAEQIDSSFSVQKEPRLALFGGNDGLDLYRQLIKQIEELSSNRNLKFTAILEIDPSQTKAIKKAASAAAAFEAIKDYSGRERFVIAEF